MGISVGDFIYAAFAAAAFAVSCLLTPLMRRLAIRVGAFDRPDGKRKLQKKPVPYFGGIAIVLAFLIVSVVGMAYFGVMPQNYLIIAVGTALIAILGLIDDIFNLKAYIKFMGQILIALGTTLAGGAVEYVTMFGKYIPLGDFSVLLTVLWIVLVVNAVNMIDGLDGLACGISAFSLMALFVSALVNGDTTSAVICAVLCGAALGFLPYNLTPASIFMGDTGAMALGYVMACVSVFGFFKGQAFLSVIAPALILAVPVTDAMSLFFYRIFKGRNPFSSDRMHIHHRLVDMGMSPRGAVMTLYIISAAFSISAIVYIRSHLAALIIAIAAFALMAAIRFFPRKKKNKDEDSAPATGGVPDKDKEENA